MTKKWLICIVTIVSLLLPHIFVSAVELPSNVMVGLYFGASAKQSVTVEAAAGFQIGIHRDRQFQQVIETGETQVTVRTGANANEIEVLDSAGTVLYTSDDQETGLGLRPIYSDIMDEVFTLDGSQYRGGLNFVRSGDSMVVVNVVGMEQYLYGVISREMSSSWPVEALKAQAVCARNYVANNLNKHAEYGFDVCNGVDCQAYSGTKPEGSGSYAPVDETAGEVLTYDGSLAELYYSSSMGNCTEDVANVWGNSVPYLVSVDNSYEDTENIPNGKWEGTLTREEATTIMRNKGYDVGDVTSIRAIEYSPAGRVTKLEVTGTAGTQVFEREACRTIFNTVTKSQMYTVRGDAEQSGEEVAVTDGAQESMAQINEVLILGAGGAVVLRNAPMYTSNGVYQKKFDAIPEAQSTVFYFEGTGWGHSVGMSQYGAKGMAEAGFTYDEILDNYFPGTRLETAY